MTADGMDGGDRRTAMAEEITAGTRLVDRAVVEELAANLTTITRLALANLDIDDDLARELAGCLLAVAEVAMPDTYFATDSRCQLARAVLTATGDPRAEEHP